MINNQDRQNDQIQIRVSYHENEIYDDRFSLFKTKGVALCRVLTIIWVIYIIMSMAVLTTTSYTYQPELKPLDVETILNESIKQTEALESLSPTEKMTSDTDSVTDTESDTETNTDTETDTTTESEIDSKLTNDELDVTYEDESEDYDEPVTYVYKPIPNEPTPSPYINNDNDGDGYRYFATEDELYYFYRIVTNEIGSGHYESKIRVAQVILNRIESSRFNNDMIGVIFAPGQFQFISTETGDIWLPSEPTQDTINACNEALVASTPDYTMGALFFCNQSCDFSSWATYLFTDIDGHNFYK